MSKEQPEPIRVKVERLTEQRDEAMKRLAAVHKSSACAGTYFESDQSGRRWCDCGYLTLLDKWPELAER